MAIYSGFTHWKWWFSIVMLVYQRVWSATYALSFPVGHTQAQVAIGDDRGRVDWFNHKHGIVKNINWDFGVQLLWRFTSFTLCITPLNAHIWNNIYIYIYIPSSSYCPYIYIYISLSIYLYIYIYMGSMRNLVTKKPWLKSVLPSSWLRFFSASPVTRDPLPK